MSQSLTKKIEIERDSSALIQVIERAATNPDIDIEKMERLLQMQERVMERNAKMAFNTALTNAQIAMRPVSADAHNPQTRSKYASYAALDKALRPIYTENGFALSFNTGEGAPIDQIRVLCTVSHTVGHSHEYHVDMPSDGKGAKGGDVMTKTHAVGAGLSYGMRYLLKMIFNVAIGEDDRDGNNPPALISVAQALTIDAALKENMIDSAKLLKCFKIEKLEDLPASDYRSALTAIQNTVSARKSTELDEQNGNGHPEVTLEDMAGEISQLMKLPVFTEEQRGSAQQFINSSPTHEAVAKKLAQIKSFVAKSSKEEAKKSKSKPKPAPNQDADIIEGELEPQQAEGF